MATQGRGRAKLRRANRRRAGERKIARLMVVKRKEAGQRMWMATKLGGGEEGTSESKSVGGASEADRVRRLPERRKSSWGGGGRECGAESRV